MFIMYVPFSIDNNKKESIKNLLNLKFKQQSFKKMKSFRMCAVKVEV